MSLQDRIQATIQYLRTEIRDLKRCQLQYFVISITATSALLGLSSALISPAHKGLSALTPLGLLFPCWLIFFDKATTITRLVGYQRALEAIIAESKPVPERSWFLGLETAIGRFRKAQDEGHFDDIRVNKRRVFLNVLLLRTRHRFWMLNWYTFVSLSVLCVGIGYNLLPAENIDIAIPLLRSHIVIFFRDIGLVAGLIVILVALYTFALVVSLVQGINSYRGNTLAWNRLLETALAENKASGTSTSAN